MDFFDKLSDTIVTAGKEVGKKAKDMSDIAKLQYEVKTKEDFLSAKFEELGRKYYVAHRGEDIAESNTFDEIEVTMTRIQDLKEEIMELKGAKACPNCGSKVPENATFCSTCGTKVNNIFEDEDEN